MIKYTNISYKEYCNLSDEESKKPYCIELYNRAKKYKFYRKYHREDGPAIMWEDGTKSWYLNDIEYSFEKWLKLTPISDDEKVFLRLKYT